MKVHIFLQAVTEEWKRCPHWRYGQAVYNVARRLFVQNYQDEFYLGGEIIHNPFHDDKKVNEYIGYLKKCGYLE